MIFKLSADAATIQATDAKGRAQYWVQITPDEYEHPFTDWKTGLFDDWKAKKREAEQLFVEEARQIDNLLKWATGDKETTEDKAREAGQIITFKDATRTLYGKLLLRRADGGELAHGLRAYLMDDSSAPLRFYVDLDAITTAEECNQAFEAAREAVSYYRRTRSSYATMSDYSGTYATYDAPYLPRKAATTAPERGSMKGNTAQEKPAEKAWKVEQDGPGITIRVTHPDGKARMAVMLPAYWREGTDATQADIEEQERLAKDFKPEKSFTTDKNPAIVPGIYEICGEYYVDIAIYNAPWKIKNAYKEIRAHRGAEEPAEAETSIGAINATASALEKAASAVRSIRRKK